MNILNDITKKYLKLNRKRTIVSIIEIVLSGAMISAVTTLAVSFQGFMLDVEESNNGSYESIIENSTPEIIEQAEEQNNFKDIIPVSHIGMAENDFSDENFIRIMGVEKENIDKVAGMALEGRMPENENEIVVSTSFFNEETPYIGDKITLKIGKRLSDGYELIGSPKEENEEFEVEETRTFTICGIINRPYFETYYDYYNAAIILVDRSEILNSEKIDLALIDKNSKNIYEDSERLAESVNVSEDDIQYNNSVLMYKGVSLNSGFNAMLYSVCGILIVVIMIGSILVIYNGFAISVSERKKQIGMLISIGATKKQIKKSVLFEGVILGVIGIPLGILCGVLGIGITLKIVSSLIAPLLTFTQKRRNRISYFI